MDKQLVDGLIKLVIEDSGGTNVYNHLEDLLLMLDDEELYYFLEQCDEYLFFNCSLLYVLSKIIPQKMKEYAEVFVHNKLHIIDLMENSLKKEYFIGRISKELYDETIKEYEEVRTEGNKFLALYMIEIEKELKKQ